MRIQHNIMAMNSYRNYTANNSALSKNLEKLSSGYKINRAGDDAAGLAISEKMRAQITGLETAQSNAQSGINLVQTAEGALTEVHDMLNRMVELADQSANGTYDNDTDRTNLQKEFDQLRQEINRIADASNFNGKALLNGDLNEVGKVTYTAGTDGAKAETSDDTAAITTIDFENKTGADVLGGKITIGDQKFQFVEDADDVETGYTAVEIAKDDDGAAIATALEGEYTNGTATGEFAAAVDGTTNTKVNVTSVDKGATAAAAAADAGGLTLQIGDTADTYNKITVSVSDMHADNLGIGEASISDQAGAAAAVTAINAAIDKVSATRGNLGATQNRLEHTINNLSVMTENVQDAEANIRDVDVAKEMMEYTKNNILVQSAQAMLAQANQVPQGVLQLLQ